VPAAVLVVEDDVYLRELMETMLHGEGFAPITAPNGAEAMTLLRAGAPAKVILLDLMMPVMDGWTFRRVQQADPHFAAIPVVVTTAVEDPRTRHLQAAAVFTKPLDFAGLMACVHQLVDR
jgi:CheY-like chemotaxis protein